MLDFHKVGSEVHTAMEEHLEEALNMLKIPRTSESAFYCIGGAQVTFQR